MVVIKLNRSGDYNLRLKTDNQTLTKLELSLKKGIKEESAIFLVIAKAPHTRRIWISEGTQVEDLAQQSGGGTAVQWSLELERERMEENQKKLHVINTRRSWFCSICKDEGFVKREDLENHSRVKHPEVKADSKMKSVSKEEYEKAKAAQYPFACEECGWAFKREKDLQQHKEKKKHKSCEKCTKRFRTQEGLDAHEIAKHPLINRDEEEYYYGRGRDLYCPVCYRHKTVQHAKQLNQTKHWRCPFCMKKFALTTGLKKHILDAHGTGKRLSDALQRSKKTHMASVAIIPPIEAQESIQQIRRQHDRQIKRWMPHLNLVYPCYPVSDFAEVEKRLRYALRDTKPFTITFSEFDYFDQDKECVAWLKPVSDPPTALSNLATAVTKVLDVKKVQFNAHLTIGQFPGVDEVKAWIEEANKTWVPLTFEVNHLDMIARDSETAPFTLRSTAPFQDSEAPFPSGMVPDAEQQTTMAVKGVTTFTRKQLGQLSQLSDSVGKFTDIPCKPFHHLRLSDALLQGRMDQYKRRSHRRRSSPRVIPKVTRRWRKRHHGGIKIALDDKKV